jgi:hypothetical protein
VRGAGAEQSHSAKRCDQFHSSFPQLRAIAPFEGS